MHGAVEAREKERERERERERKRERERERRDHIDVTFPTICRSLSGRWGNKARLCRLEYHHSLDREYVAVLKDLLLGDAKQFPV